jgi:hypothetical protein
MRSIENSDGASYMREQIRDSVRTILEPLVRELRSPSAVMPVLAGADHKRIASVRERLAAIDCEIEETTTRLHANARRLASMGETPKPAQPASPSPPSSGGVLLPFFGKRVKP